MTKIKANAIYGDGHRDPIVKSDPPKGCVRAQRYYDGGRSYMIGEPWPPLEPGQEIEVETTNHWIWRGKVEQIIDADVIFFRPSGPKVAVPLPPIETGKPYRLPWMSGDAWSRKPESGTVLMIGDKPYKVIGKPKPHRQSGGYDFVLREVDPKEYATRPGSVALNDNTDPNPGLFYYGHNVGRIVKIGEEFLHVTKVERRPYGDAERTTIFGYNTVGFGRFVSAEKAAKLDAKWRKAQGIRAIEHSLKVARQDLDYGGNPEAIPGLEAKLEKARKSL